MLDHGIPLTTLSTVSPVCPNLTAASMFWTTEITSTVKSNRL